MKRKEEIKRIFNKIDKIAQDGDLSLQDYYAYIDDLIDEGKYSLLLDVMLIYYKLNMWNFNSIEDFKKKSFNTIKFNTIKESDRKLSSLFLEKSVYNIGTHFYNSENNKYLGDIIQTEPEYQNSLSLLQKRPWTNEIVNLSVVRGLSSAIFNSIPEFGSIGSKYFFYTTQSQVTYVGSVYECINSFTYSKDNPITPTYSDYFTQSSMPNYSYISIHDKKMSILDKYSLGIDILKL